MDPIFLVIALLSFFFFIFLLSFEGYFVGLLLLLSDLLGFLNILATLLFKFFLYSLHPSFLLFDLLVDLKELFNLFIISSYVMLVIVLALGLNFRFLVNFSRKLS